jgi:copper transport protein
MRLIALIAWALLALTMPAPPVLAHASLIEATPADGQVLREAPKVVRLRFNEPVSPLVARLFATSGEIATNLPIRIIDERIEVELPDGLAPGSYALSYRVSSADGHPVGGSIGFSVGLSSGAVTGAAPDQVVAGLLWLSRLIMYVGLFVGVGGAFFLAWLARSESLPSARSVAATTMIAGISATILALGYQGLDALGASLRSYWTQTVWGAAMGTAFGVTAALAVLALSASLASLFVLPRALSAVGLVGVGLALAASGHASVAGPLWLTRPAVFVHAVAVAYWVGAFVPLWVLLRDRAAPAAKIVGTWSAGAVFAVALLTLTGTALALIQVPAVADLYRTDYGWVLLAKLVAVAALLGLAARNRLRFTPALGAAARKAEMRLGQSVAAELALALAIVGIVGLWRFTPPPRAIAAGPPPPVAVAYLHGTKAMAEVRLQPARPGPIRATIFAMSADHTPLDPKEVSFAMSKPDLGLEPLQRGAVLAAPGEWHVSGLVVPVGGRWEVRVDLLITDFEKVALNGIVEIEHR